MTIMKVRWFLLFICVRAWQNDFDRQLHFECPTGQSISRVESIHNDHFEDRVWKFSCRNKGKLGKCQWFYNQNDYDAILLFQCPNNGAIVATRSHHDNHREDRRFSFKCCERKGGTSFKNCSRCHFTAFANGFDHKIDYHVPNNKFLRGVFSYHQNYQEDRRWKFEVCDL